MYQKSFQVHKGRHAMSSTTERKIRACTTTKQDFELAEVIKKNFPMFEKTKMTLAQSADWLSRQVGYEVTVSAVIRIRDVLELHWGQKKKSNNSKPHAAKGVPHEDFRILCDEVARLFDGLGMPLGDGLIELARRESERE